MHKNRGLDQGLPYTDGERVISAGALVRLTLLNLQYKINYIKKVQDKRSSTSHLQEALELKIL